MSNITPTKPSFVFGYWRPWKENSNLFDSYLDYTKDVSLVKYGADTVGKYISQASKEQVQAINQLGQAIGRGMNVLSNQMSDINKNLIFLNRNIDVQIEQQKLSNLLLQNIAELLRVPDSEKERQHSIELGIKFFVNASKDADLYADALEELLKAESLMKQDYFVLHRIGCIYLYVEKYINPEKALDYFLRAAKYASVESDSNAVRLVNVLTKNFNELNLENSDTKCKNFNDVVDIIKSGNKIGAVKLLKDKTGWALKECVDWVDDKIECGLKSYSVINKGENSPNQIGLLASDSLEKAAFAAYVLGRFSDAVNYQAKALKFNETSQNRFILSKYQIRNGEINEGVNNLSKCIDDESVYAVAAFKEIDLINEPEILNLISNKNQDIDNEIGNLLVKWKAVESTKASDVIKELTELSQKSYEIKVSLFKALEKKAIEINKNIGDTESEIDTYISIIKKTIFCDMGSNEIQSIIDKLTKAKDLPLEKMKELLITIKKQVDANKLKIGSKYAGGIVFYIDKTGNHGLVCADKSLGKAVWGGDSEIGALGDGVADGSGLNNTMKIVEKASWFLDKGFFWSTKRSASTAARLCLESNYNGFSDWYLPTRSELRLIHKRLRWNKLSEIDAPYYWSSTESSCSYAWGSDFKNESTSNYNLKSSTGYVLAVRAF